MLSVADAARTVIERVPRLAAELVALDDAVDRILAMNILAPRSLPGFDNSAMDGYAVRASEIPGALPIAGEVAAGAVRVEPVPAQHCVRIFTGGAMPADLDTVVMQEDVTTARNLVTFPAAPRGDNVRHAGEDVAIGDTVLVAGTRLTPWHIGLLAALGVARVPVSRKPRVAIIATGDELVTVDVAPGPGQLVASSSHALAALVRECGGEPHVLGIARDDIDAITAMITRALGDDAYTNGSSASSDARATHGASHASASSASSAGSHASASSAGSHASASSSGSHASASSSSTTFDVVITTGGVSVGDRDHVHAALERAGVTRELYKVAMKPGKPFAFGMRRAPSGGAPSNRDKPVFGLPGNPVSTVVAFELFVRPALLAMQRASVIDRPRAIAQLAHAYRKQAGRAHYLRAHLTREGERLIAHTHAKQGSAMLSSLVGSNALVEIPADASELDAGAQVSAILLEAV